MSSTTSMFVRVPDGRDPQQAIRRADVTVNIFAATFTCPDGETYIAEEDGTFEVRSPSTTASLVRRALEENERLIVEREEPFD